MPDFFRGKGWKTDNIPPKEGRPAMQAYIQSIGSWELVRPDLVATIEFLRGERMVDSGVSLLQFPARVVFEVRRKGFGGFWRLN